MLKKRVGVNARSAFEEAAKENGIKLQNNYTTSPVCYIGEDKTIRLIDEKHACKIPVPKNYTVQQVKNFTQVGNIQPVNIGAPVMHNVDAVRDVLAAKTALNVPIHNAPIIRKAGSVKGTVRGKKQKNVVEIALEDTI